MVSKFLLFSALWWLTGNPFVALLTILIILYLLDMRFVRLFPDITKPFKRNRNIARLKQELRLNPHHTSAKLDLARMLMEKGEYQEALSYLKEIEPMMKESSEYLSDLGICQLKLGALEEGEKLISQALQENPRVKYGEPYLRLGEAFAKANQQEKALAYLEKVRSMHASSCEAYYKQGLLYQQLGQQDKAKNAFREAVEVYRGLPAYKRRSERRWAILSRLKG